jgi:hypothetical protein
MEIYGSGMLNLGYLGGVYDVGTGLIYTCPRNERREWRGWAMGSITCA